MRVEIRRERAILALLFLAVAIARAAPDAGVGAIPLPIQSALPVEAPSSIFKASLGHGPDDDAELLISGTWSATALSSLDLQSQPGGVLAPTLQPLLFTQTPDIAFSFLLFKKIFVEGHVSDDITQAKWSGGYRGGPGDLLREAKIGNDGISFPSLPFLAFGDGSYRSFGASATIATDNFTGRAMVRYDQAEQVVKHFVGGTEVTEAILSPNSFIAGKYFMTLKAPATNLAVYVQSSSGTLAGSDGNSYRQLGSDEYSYAIATGIISLTAAAATKVLASYPGSGSGADSVTIAGVACDLLYVPPPVPSTGSLDPKLGLLDRYATTANPTSAEAFVRNPSSGLRDVDYLARIDVGGFIEVTRVGAEDPTSADPAVRGSYRRPFESAAYANMAWLYTTDFASGLKVGSAPVYTREVVVQSYATSTVINIDRDFVAGSILVTRNGIPDYSFSVDANTGVLTLLSPPSPSEEITITYMRESTERASGIIVGALGGFWDLGQSEQAYAALGATWSVPGSSYSTGSQTSPGSINLTAGETKGESAFTHDEALAARYSQDDATGTYRLEGMESNSGYSSDFMPASTALGYPTSVEILDKGLVLLFPILVNSLHADGSTQLALELIAGSTVPGAGGQGTFTKVESAPPYSSFKTLSFFAKFSSTASLTLSLGDGAPTPNQSARISLPAGSGNGAWRRFLLHYGKGDPTVYSQDNESAAEVPVPGATSISPSLTSTGSMLTIDFVASQVGDQAWVDEVLLVDSVGSLALLFQGQTAYDDPDFEFGIGGVPILSKLKVSADTQAAYDSSPYASGGAEIDSNFLFARLGIKARATAASGSTPYFSGGHTIELPTVDFPVTVKDEFDYDPSSGAFGREDSLAIKGASIASLSAEQKAAWTPPSDVLDLGLLIQSWDAQLTLGPSIATLGLTADNRSRPSPASVPGSGSGSSYFSTWLGAFQYVLPAYESDSELRDTKASLSIKNGAAREFLSASISESDQPSAGGGTRNDSAQAKIALPIEAVGLSVEPYYSRTWNDTRSDDSTGIVDGASAALKDFATLPVLYAGLPFAELGSAGTASDFFNQTAPSGVALAEADFTPEAGLSLSREYGSKWYDFLVPSALTFSYGRALARAADQTTDADVWSTTAKFASINLFGSMGAYPTRLPFDSDEYLSTLQAKLQMPQDGSASSFDLQFHGLATLYSGEFDKLDSDSKVSFTTAPGSLDWTGSLMLSLSRRVARHWLLDLYSLATRPATAAAAPKEGKPNAASVASMYLSDLATREPNVRTTISITAGLSGYQSDAVAYQPGWAFEESYEAKLTVPERLTLKLDATLDQSLLASTQVLTLGFQLGITVAVSF